MLDLDEGCRECGCEIEDFTDQIYFALYGFCADCYDDKANDFIDDEDDEWNDIEELERLHAATTQLQWETVPIYNNEHCVYLVRDPRFSDWPIKKPDAEFCAEIHNAFPAILAELRELRELRKRMAESIEMRCQKGIRNEI